MLLSVCICHYLRRRNYNFPRSHVKLQGRESRCNLLVSGARRQRNGERETVTAYEATRSVEGAAVVFAGAISFGLIGTDYIRFRPYTRC